MHSTQHTVREVLRLLFEADSYPCICNTDWTHADELRAIAVAKARTAIDEPGDPPQLRSWLNELIRPNLDPDRRDEIYDEVGVHIPFGNV